MPAENMTKFESVAAGKGQVIVSVRDLDALYVFYIYVGCVAFMCFVINGINNKDLHFFKP